MKRSEMILLISEKLQKQMHLINSEVQRNYPKMLCDNLAMRVLSAVEQGGMLPPYLAKYDDPKVFESFNGYVNEWEPEDEEE